jgi:hypothetical protein
MGWFARSGTDGVDFSVNPATVPVAGWVLLLTIPPKRNRNFVEVQNQSTSVIQIVRIDATGTISTSIFAAGASATPGQGGGWSSDTFKGEIIVYGPTTGLQIAAYED